jgi:hypothetical protein
MQNSKYFKELSKKRTYQMNPESKKVKYAMLWVENGRDKTGTSFEDPEEDPTQLVKKLMK